MANGWFEAFAPADRSDLQMKSGVLRVTAIVDQSFRSFRCGADL